jgi:hypothetical protein
MTVYVKRQRRRGRATTGPGGGSSPGRGWAGTRYVVIMESPPSWNERRIASFTRPTEAATYAEWVREFDAQGILGQMLDARAALRMRLQHAA